MITNTTVVIMDFGQIINDYDVLPVRIKYNIIRHVIKSCLGK